MAKSKFAPGDLVTIASQHGPKTSAGVEIRDIKLAKVRQTFNCRYGTSQPGLELEILIGSGRSSYWSGDSNHLNLANSKWHAKQYGGFLNPERFGPGQLVRVFERPFRLDINQQWPRKSESDYQPVSSAIKVGESDLMLILALRR